MNEAAIRLIIADEDQIFLRRIRHLVATGSDVTVAGEERDHIVALQMVDQLRPDILLLGTDRTEPALQLLRTLINQPAASSVRVILLVAAAEKNQIIGVLQLGTRGIVLKNSADQFLLESIHTVMEGEYWVGKERVSDLVQYLRNLVKPSDSRETEQRLVNEIAKHFKISLRAAKERLRKSLMKLPKETVH